jgi:hypothetical protein
MDRKQLATAARIVAGVMLILALGSWEYSYYQLLRIVVCVSAAFLAWYFFEKQQHNWGWVFVVTGILFNPIFPIYLARETWQMIDLAGAGVFFASFSADTKKR